jgi:inosose dehydratase
MNDMKIANAPCSWGILEFDLEGPTVPYQKMLDEMSATGYRGTELGDWGYLPIDPKKLKNELGDRNLKLVGAFVPVNFRNPDDHDKGQSIALKTARLLADVHKSEAKIVLSDENGLNPFRTRNAGRILPEHSLSQKDWEIFASGVEKIAEKIVKETGLPSVFHHHCAGFVETPDEIRTLMKMTDPELVNLCFDTGHYAYGGGDPAEGLDEFSDRIKHVHFKDFNRVIAERAKQEKWGYFKSVENGIFSELGEGSIDFKKIYGQLKEINYNDWIVVEQDILPGMGSPKESAKRNREFLHSIGL